MGAETMLVRCCIAGGGPAGMMLGLLLARAGVDVVVLEKHADFLRDFRGDTIHPSTLEVVHELGLLKRLLTLPHQEVSRINGQFGDLALTVADFSSLSTQCRFVVFMPQWDFLNFLADEAARYSTFQLRRQTDVTGLVEEAGSVVGILANTPDGPLEVRASLVVGADGRHSVVRAKAGLSIEEFGAPMDVLSFREAVAQLAPFMADRVGELHDWEPIKLLTVQVDRLRQWYRPGLLCIGDAAHAMSPVGGVGINLAIQDAVATANLLTAPLRAGRLTIKDLSRVQRRREWPTRMTQRVQLMIQDRVISRVLTDRDRFSPPFAIRLLALIPFLRRIPARMIGLGFRPEHVHTSDSKTPHASAEVVSP